MARGGATAAIGGGTDLTRPPYRIPGKVLDANYVASNPARIDGSNQPYSVKFTKNGWQLVPTAAFVVCENGKPVNWLFFGQRAPAA